MKKYPSTKLNDAAPVRSLRVMLSVFAKAWHKLIVAWSPAGQVTRTAP
ncbi:hypothetical protein SAMN04487769_0594 [Burkholderia sp. b14]|nr:hypothetical protein SAMN04487769_0594 [Burkholderia sp. b14]